MPENGRTIIAVRDVAFGYTRKKTVLEHVSFDVPQGQSLAILGYNGVGKTTLFNIIVGLLRPRSGEAVINANLVPSMQDVFQLSDESNLAATMTVRENIRFRAMLMDTGRAFVSWCSSRVVPCAARIAIIPIPGQSTAAPW